MRKNPLGLKQYNAWKKDFRCESSPHKALEKVETDEDDQINPALLKVTIAYRRNKNKAVFNGVLHTLDVISLEDLVGICQYGLIIRPSASADQLRYGIDLMLFFARLQVSRRFPDQAELMTKLFDKVLVEAHCGSSQKQSLPSTFLDRFEE
jgi:hypothetical protein